eukprot:TRINITY_DN1437_c0_g1_i1.p1 TRINITY_DN1437_c0_g1~~TRINITY_DN1437_c0_g1_i1.p1  ORF type:complete len:224 (-),score=70.86 TRINITY_DN1437_c0_g1_i1:130-708(-)
MELAEEITRGFQIIANTSLYSPKAFSNLVDVSFAILLKEKEEDQIDVVLADVEKLARKQGYACLTGFILEGAKHNLDGVQMKDSLEENRVDKEQIAYFVKKYETHKKALRDLLSTTSFNYPHIVGVDWRLDYQIKSSRVERVDAATYFIKLKAKTNEGQNKDVEFNCSLEQLQDLVVKLKDASKQVDRILGQ